MSKTTVTAEMVVEAVTKRAVASLFERTHGVDGRDVADLLGAPRASVIRAGRKAVAAGLLVEVVGWRNVVSFKLPT